MNKLNEFPKGWNESRVGRILKHYGHQTDAQAVAEDAAVFEPPTHTAIKVPVGMVLEVPPVIAHRRPSRPIQPGRKRVTRG